MPLMVCLVCRNSYFIAYELPSMVVRLQSKLLLFYKLISREAQCQLLNEQAASELLLDHEVPAAVVFLVVILQGH